MWSHVAFSGYRLKNMKSKEFCTINPFSVSAKLYRLIAVLPFAHAVNHFIAMLSYRGTCVPSGLTIDLVEEMLYVWACLVTSSMIAFPTSGLNCRFLQG